MMQIHEELTYSREEENYIAMINFYCSSLYDKLEDLEARERTFCFFYTNRKHVLKLITFRISKRLLIVKLYDFKRFLKTKFLKLKKSLEIKRRLRTWYLFHNL
jgi:hypothetical protein